MVVIAALQQRLVVLGFHPVFTHDYGDVRAREIDLVIFLTLSTGLLTIPLNDPPEGQTEITGDVQSSLDEGVLVTVSTNETSETIWIPSPSLYSRFYPGRWSGPPPKEKVEQVSREYLIQLEAGVSTRLKSSPSAFEMIQSAITPLVAATE